MPTNLARGQRVGERYRLVRELGRGTRSVTWEATDERLDRPVALRLFDDSLDRRTLVRRAGVAASLTHPRVVRVFDTGQDGAIFFTVSELLPGSLDAVRLPLEPRDALNTAIDVAEALEYAHERGIVHGHLHEGNVLLSEAGAKVADFGLATVARNADRRDDLRALGAILARVTAGSDLPSGFRRLVVGLTSGSYGSATEVLSDLRSLRPAPPRSAPSGPARRPWLAIAVMLLVGVAAFGATRLGGREHGTQFVPGGHITGTPLRISAATDFDPEGDRHENTALVSKAVDGDPQTFWTTEHYTTSPDFNGRKRGVGIVLDLGSPLSVGKAQVLFTTPGCSFELRYSALRTAPLDAWPVAATVNRSPLSAAITFDGATARYWLLWITRLTAGVPGAGSAYACGVAEVELFAP